MNGIPKVLKIGMSDQTYALLEKINRTGLWGRTVEETAQRIIEQRLWEWIDKPVLRVGV